MIFRIFFLGLVFLLCADFSDAQLLDHAQGQLLIKLKKGEDPRRWTLDFQRFEGAPAELAARERLSEHLHIWLYSFNFPVVNEERLLAAVRRHPAVEVAQFNHFLEWRTEPDDPGFAQQWQYINTGQSGGLPGADIDMELAWDITTGGLTAEGDTIVVCVIDDGIDPGHQDFGENLWINYAEIPNNGVDDDGNGFIDDYRGWNTVQDNDNIFADGGHGTPVAGIVGARGNNGIGVAGVSWHVKVMVVLNSGLSEAQVIEAYSYPLNSRIMYNESGGEEGAFVVATNASWGINFGQPDDAPLWCAFYDTLGVHGIISCGATINGNVDVDAQGDLPTGCASDYLISVTNMNHQDIKVNQAGYGLTTVDLGAFGQGTWTTALGDNYGGFGGTSGATPHVAGTVGLLYSAPCPSFIALAKALPGEAALLAKQYIMDGVDPNESLEGITVTGGRLNVHNSLQLLMANCGPCPPPAGLRAEAVSDTSAVLSWVLTDSVNFVDLRWRPVGDTLWAEAPAAESPFALDSLTACTEYEFELKAFCNADTLDFGPGERFKTEGCCELPAEFTLGYLDDSTAAFSWTEVLAADGFALRIRELGAETWDTLAVDGQSTTSTFEGLAGCTEYEVEIRTKCASDSLVFGNGLIFRTKGCGPCRDREYCIPDGLSTEEEWIDSVSIFTLQWASGSNEGYGDFSDMPELVLEAGLSYPVTLTPGYSDFQWTEYFVIYIDLDQDGDFGIDEIVFDPGAAVTGPVSGSLQIPFDAPLGGTRLRVVMQYENVTGNCTFPSGSFGEVEDYCVQIVEPTTCPPAVNLDTVFVAQTMARLEWEHPGGASSYRIAYRGENDPEWDTLEVAGNNIWLMNLTTCTEYVAEVIAVCPFGASENVAGPILFETACPPSSTRALPIGVRFDTYPNPFHESLQVVLEVPERYRAVRLDLIDAHGRVVEQRNVAPAAGVVSWSGEALPAGLYFLRLHLDGRMTAVRRIVKL